MDLGLRDRVAIVTGAGSGIGLATCRRLLEAGVKVVGGDLKPDGLDALSGSGEVFAVQADLTDPLAAPELVREAKSRFGGVDVLVNCAGIAPTREGFLSIGDDDFVRTLDVNFLGTVRACRAAIPAMIERGGGAIVSIASDAGKLPDPFFTDYSVSKAAIIVLSKTLSMEFGPKGIRSNVVTPGPIRTPLIERPGGFAESLSKMYGVDRDEALVRFAKEERRMPIARFADPDEVATVCVFLASDRAGFVTGSDFPVDGGTIPVV